MVRLVKNITGSSDMFLQMLMKRNLPVWYFSGRVLATP